MVSRLHRLIRIIRSVSGERYPGVKDLCSKLEVSERTLFHDLRELQDELGVNIQFDKSRGGYRLLGDISEINVFSLTEESALLMHLSMYLLINQIGVNLSQAFVEQFSKEIAFVLGAKLIEFSGESKNQLSIDNSTFLALYRASVHSEIVEVEFHNNERFAGKPKIFVDERHQLRLQIECAAGGLNRQTYLNEIRAVREAPS